MTHNIRIGIISSNGGHLFQAIQLKKIFNKYSHFWIIPKSPDSSYFLKKERTYFVFPYNRWSFFHNIAHVLSSIKILYKEKPSIIISCGAGIAVPYILIGKYIFKCKTIFIEPVDFIAYPSMTGKILYHVVDLFLIQDKIQIKWYPKAKYWGSLL